MIKVKKFKNNLKFKWYKINKEDLNLIIVLIKADNHFSD